MRVPVVVLVGSIVCAVVLAIISCKVMTLSADKNLRNVVANALN